MFFYYCSFFRFKNINIKNNIKILGLYDLTLFFRTGLNIKEKYHLKHDVYFLIKNKYKFFINFYLKYFILYYKRLKRKILNLKLNLKKNNKLKFSYLCKRKRFSYKLKYIKYYRKRKYKYISPFSKNKKARKKYLYFKHKRTYIFKKMFIYSSSLMNNNIFYKIFNYCFYNRNYYYYTNKYNNFILNSFYNKRESYSFLYFFNKEKYIYLLKYIKIFKYFNKNLNSMINMKKKFANYKHFKKLSRKIKNLYELYDIDKYVLFDKIYNLKIPLQIKKKY